MCAFVHWIRKDYVVKLAVVLALLNIFLYVYSGIVPNPYPNGYVGKFENDANSEYAVMSLGIRSLQVTDGTIEISHIYRYQPWLWSESRKANVDIFQNPAYFSGWGLIADELPPPPELAGEIQTVPTSATVVAPLEMMLEQYDSLVRSSGNSFWFPFDKYDFRVSISALLPDGVEIWRKQVPNEKIKEIPFGFFVYSNLNGFNVKAIPESDNVLHITLQRPARVIAIYIIPIVALLILIIISLKSHLDFFESNKGILVFLSLVLGLIPILLSLLFTPSGIQRPSLFDCIEYALAAVFIIIMVIAYGNHEIRKETPKGK